MGGRKTPLALEQHDILSLEHAYGNGLLIINSQYKQIIEGVEPYTKETLVLFRKHLRRMLEATDKLIL